MGVGVGAAATVVGNRVGFGERMSPEKKTTRTRGLELEQEVDFGRYIRELARRWWLLALAAVLGAIVGFALTLGGSDLYRAKATIYLGQPLAANNSTQIQSLSTNPSTVRQLARSESILERASTLSGVPVGKLRSGISTQTVSGYLSKLGQSPLVSITLKANARPKSIGVAINEIARLVVETTSAYSRAKIATIEAQIVAGKRELSVIDKRLNAINSSLASGNLSATEQLVLLTSATISEQRRGAVSDSLQQGELLLVQARTVEQGQIVSRGSAVKTTARSPRNAVIVGAALGLIAGVLAALALANRRESSA
jgi:capsular polysaccharide biosynthesis protein